MSHSFWNLLYIFPESMNIISSLSTSNKNTEVYITFGIPQGSMIGPVLFLAFQWPVYPRIRCVLFISLTVFASESDINNAHATVNWKLVGVDNWLKANRLSLNVSKISYLQFPTSKTHWTFQFKIQSLRKFQR